MKSARSIDPRKLPPYDLGSLHPFARDRLLPLFDLLERSGLIADDDYLPPVPGDRSLLALAHDLDYVDVVESLSVPEPTAAARARGPAFGRGTDDNPIAPGQHAAAAAVVGATVACVRAIADGTTVRAFQPSGGLHHAMRRAASGFCIYNDLVVAIRVAQQLGFRRVAYLDLDVHHGDGVERAFEDDPTVLTVSWHETPRTRWPGTGAVTDRGRGAGVGSVVNVPLEPRTDDAGWLAAIDAVLPIVERFRPDLIVSQHGCDPHVEDPLADLAVSTRGFLGAAQRVRALADRVCGGRLVATGGGGYQPVRVLARAWAIVWAVLAGRELPERIDSEWLRRWQPAGGAPLVPTFLDPVFDVPGATAAARGNAAVLARLSELNGLQGRG